MPIFSSVENLHVVHRLARAAVLLACAGAFSAGAQTLLPSITSGISPARGASLTNVVIPRAVAPVAQAGTAATAAATDATGLSAAPMTGKADAGTDAKADAKPGVPRSKASATDGSELMAAEAIREAKEAKEAKADEIEFQRFVLATTGQALRLYGYELFGKTDNFAALQGAPVPAGYILGPGDEVVVQVNGLLDVNARLVIDRDGRVMVPKVGPLNLAGVPLNEAEAVMASHIGKVYRNFSVSLTMGRLRSIEVFVVGQARKPGKHVVSSLSSLINALFETGGPTSNGSLRAIELRRGGKTIASVDLYAFLSQGDTRADAPLLAGDVIYIPAAGARAAVLGTTNAPAIYELRPGETIGQVLALSGGLPMLASPHKAQLERVDANRDIARYVEDFALDATGMKQPMKAGDVLTVFQISPQIANVVTLQGNVAAPLRYTFQPGMRVADLLSDRRLLIPGSYWSQINLGVLADSYSQPEVNLDYATIQRLDPVALRTRTIAFNLGKAIARDAVENLELLSGDIVTVYANDEAGAATDNSVTITGEVVGGVRRFVWRPGFTIKDIIPSTQWLVDYYGYWERRAGIDAEDEATGKTNGNADGAKDKLGGTIAKRKPKAKGADAADLDKDANFKGNETDKARAAILEKLSLVRRTNADLGKDINWGYAQVIRRVPQTLSSQALTFNLGRAVIDGSASDNIALQPGDQIALFTTKQLAVPAERRNRTVVLSGEVQVPGVYQLAAGETLPDLIKRAGGLSSQAYAYGTVFTRESNRRQQQDNLDKAVRRMEADAAGKNLAALQNAGEADKAAVNAQSALQQQMAARIATLKATGRVSLELNAAAPTLPPIVLEDGDTILVPQRPSFVGVFGEVFAESSLIHRPAYTVADYLDRSGVTRDADLDNVLVFRADGTVEGTGNRTSLWGSHVSGKKLNAGDTIYVPGKVDRTTLYTTFIQGAKDWTAILYQLGLGAAAVKTLRN